MYILVTLTDWLGRLLDFKNILLNGFCRSYRFIMDLLFLLLALVIL